MIAIIIFSVAVGLWTGAAYIIANIDSINSKDSK